MDGDVIIEKDKIMEGWRQYLKELTETKKAVESCEVTDE